MPNDFTIVLDTNTLLRGLGNRDSASGGVLRLCEMHKVMLLLSRPVMSEYRRVLGSEDVKRRHRNITAESVELVLRRLRYFAQYLSRVPIRFQFKRDPMDAKFIELAIVGGATHVVTNDNDLLSLTSDYTESAKRFRQRLPGAAVLRPAEFLSEYEASR